jgi:hypothetical protein
MPDWTHVNWLAVVIATVANIVIGYVWYMPMVFGKRWEAAAGRTIAAVAPAMYAVLVVTSLLVAYGLALLFGGIGVVNGAIWGALIWLYFVATITAGAVLFEGRSWMYWAIVNGYWLLALVVMGGIVGFFPATL